MKRYLKTICFVFFFIIPSLFLFINSNYIADSSSVNDSLAKSQDSLLQDTLLIDSTLIDTNQIIEPIQLNRIIENKAFKVGEKLTFDVRYGFLTAGHATMEVKDMVMVQDSFPAYRIVSTAQSTKTFDLFFKVRDRVESILDSRGIFSWGFIKNLREGGYKFDLLVDYDQLFGKAYIEMIRYHNDDPLRVRKKEELELKIPKYVIDVLGAFYYVRTQPLRLGEPIQIPNHDNKKIYNLKVIVQRREEVKVKAGKFKCVVVQPRLKGDAIFKQKGKLWVWLTDDEFKIPVQMKSKAFIGSVYTELVKIEGIDKPITARVK